MKALIIYDDFKFATRANAALQRAAHRADTVVRWTIIPWQLEMLKFPPAADAALSEVVDAHLIVFAGRRARAFPPWLQRWLGRWAAQRHIQDAALVVIDERLEIENFNLASSDLLQFSERHGLNVISEQTTKFETGMGFGRRLLPLKTIGQQVETRFQVAWRKPHL